MTASQDTGHAADKGDNNIVFATEVHIQKAIESFPPGKNNFF